MHPQLAHYWTVNPADTEDGCDPTGTTGEWNAFTGSSGGWTDWTVDLSAYAGRKIELRIAAITDWGTLGLGAWVDDWRLTDGATQIEFQDFEQPLDASWLIGPPPEGTPLPNGWTQRGQEFIEGGVVTTEDSVYTGFGFEGINESARNEFMGRTLDAPRRRHRPAAAGLRGGAAGGRRRLDDDAVRLDDGRRQGRGAGRQGPRLREAQGHPPEGQADGAGPRRDRG